MGKSCVRWVERFPPIEQGNYLCGDKTALAVGFYFGVWMVVEFLITKEKGWLIECTGQHYNT